MVVVSNPMWCVLKQVVGRIPCISFLYYLVNVIVIIRLNVGVYRFSERDTILIRPIHIRYHIVS